MKKFFKIISFSIFIVFLISLYTNVFAAGYVGGLSPSAGTGKVKIEKIIGTFLDLIRIAGVSIATIMLLVVSSKYIMASAGERAEIKKYAITYVIGAFILFAGAGLLKIIKDLVDQAITA